MSDTIALSDNGIDVSIGLRAMGHLAFDAIRSVSRLTWRETPETGSAEARAYLNPTRPADANVLLTLNSAQPFVVARLFTKRAQRIALHVDDADALIAVVRALMTP